MKAVAIYGSPGAGKGMQATLLEHHYGFTHFDTGKFIEHTVHDPDKQKNRTIRHERKLFDAGYLNTPSWVFSIVKDKITKLSKAKESLVFSGSPRTLYEAERLVPLLERLYGRKNLVFFSLDVPKEMAVYRNLHRRVCSLCGAVIIHSDVRHKECPICSGKLVKRSLDNKKAIVRRFEQYIDRTKPIFEFLKERGYRIVKIRGNRSPAEVFGSISQHIR